MRNSIMLHGIMLFINRAEELQRLDALARRRGGGLAVVYGRRRIGKTRLLLEWIGRHRGLYTVADTSTADVQRRYFALAVQEKLPGFGDVDYRDWPTLLSHLARAAHQARWRGPIVFDELPYLVQSTPSFPSILQRWIDHEARDAALVIALAGSSQRMMQGLVLAGNAPLYGRAREVLDVLPLDPNHLRQAFRSATPVERVGYYAAWGGVPRYWELASDETGSLPQRVERLVLDPRGPLHREPDRLLLEEMPSALEARPVLDAIGGGAHRVSEIAGRLGRPATSLTRPLDRLVQMALVRREVPFGDSERSSKRSLYRIDDPFFRLWFRTVAPHRGALAAGSSRTRTQIFERHWDGLLGIAWEDLCRRAIPRLDGDSALARLGPWGPASRWWSGNLPEWDLVSGSTDGKYLLLGEAKYRARALDAPAVAEALRNIQHRPPPALGTAWSERTIIRALFVPQVGGRQRAREENDCVMTATDLGL